MVSDPRLFANFTPVPASGPAPLNVTFLDQSTGTLPIDSYSYTIWNQSGVVSTITNISSPQYQFDKAGSWNVTLNITSSGVNSSQTKTVEVQSNLYPVARFSVTPLNGTAPLNISVMDQSILDPQSPIGYTYQWYINDIVIDDLTDQPDFDYQFPSNGVYSIQLGLTPLDVSERGEIFSDIVYVTVGDSPIQANFTAVSRNGTAPLNVSFIDQSSSKLPIVSWLWEFGDGNGTSVVQNPEYSYRTPGNIFCKPHRHQLWWTELKYQSE